MTSYEIVSILLEIFYLTGKYIFCKNMRYRHASKIFQEHYKLQEETYFQ